MDSDHDTSGLTELEIQTFATQYACDEIARLNKRIEQLEKELRRLMECVSDEDAMSIANVLAPDSEFSVDTECD